MANCLEDKKWNSKVPKVTGAKEKGEFKITSELGGGDFLGKFQEDGGGTVDIRGNCSAARIWFLKPADAPEFLYDGDFLYDKNEKVKITGTRSAATVVGQQNFVPDDWEADKGT